MPAPWDGNRHGPSAAPSSAPSRSAASGRRAPPGAAGLVELEFHTAAQLHTAFEPHACVADWSDPQHLRVWLSTQGVEADAARASPSASTSTPTQVEVVAEHVGGGFGAKLALTTEAIARDRAEPRSRVARCVWCSTATRS